MKKSFGFILILLTSSSSGVNGFHLPGRTPPSSSAHTILRAKDDTKESKGDNKAMQFLRKVGRVGGAANMDFANAMGLDESPSGGTKSSYHEDGFKVSNHFLEIEEMSRYS
jgi:hypothetical protein